MGKLVVVEGDAVKGTDKHNVTGNATQSRRATADGALHGDRQLSRTRAR